MSARESSPARPAPRKGAVLLLVLWAVILLSAILVKVYGIISVDVDQAVVENKTLRARLLAESGLALARHPEIERDSPLLKHEAPGGGESMEVKIASEGARLNLNALLSQPPPAQEGEPSAPVLEDGVLPRLLVSWGLTGEEAETVRDRLADWIDADSLTRLDGAEREAYADAGQGAYPLNRPFQSMDEVREVLGVAELLDARRPGWEDAFTLYGGSGLDLQEAPAELIAAVCGVTPAQAGVLVRTRQGRDRVDGTKDDVVWKSAAEALRTLGLGLEEIEALEGRVTVGGQLFRFESTGVVGGRRVTIVEVASRGAGSREALARWERLGD